MTISVPVTRIDQLAASVKQARTERGITQEELAERLGVSRPWISQFERGQTPNAGIDRILAILSTLGLTLTISSAAPASETTAATGPTSPSPDTPTWDSFASSLKKFNPAQEKIAELGKKLEDRAIPAETREFLNNLFAEQSAKMFEGNR